MSRVFFTDRDLGEQFPEILAAAGLNVERHADHFPPLDSRSLFSKRGSRIEHGRSNVEITTLGGIRQGIARKAFFPIEPKTVPSASNRPNTSLRLRMNW